MSQNPFASSSYSTNNPFLIDNDPNAAHRRFPDLNTIDPHVTMSASSPAPSSPVYYSPIAGPSFTGYQQQYQVPAFTGFQAGYYGGAQSPNTMSPYGTPYGYGGAYQQQQQAQQSSHQLPTHLQAFDPYGSLGSREMSSPAPVPQHTAQPYPGTLNAQQTPAPAPSQAPRLGEHPRAWIRSHKQELESWDLVTWKQALLRFDELQSHWERHKWEISQRVEAAQKGYLPPHELPHWQHALKTAIENIDGVAASKLQMSEALEGYKQSTDVGSKRRVKEALNAGLLSLPDFPPQL
ncbi:hypothetical protein BKA62DRAFT_291011 [Auriculariales sp. MPI-PUGE-AT-0066]|nr:hypothetical protein BKA62DRAFT_291011 [Auriculariales sp. MPI-PUGE-AT-0066]